MSIYLEKLNCSAKYALTGLAFLTTGLTHAAVFNVPQDYNHITDALDAASSGDEIRVSKDHLETDAYLYTTGRDITIRSYSTDYTTPERGARWEVPVADGDVNTALINVSGGKLIIDGFENLYGGDCNAIYMQSDSEVEITNSRFSGITRADTAGIKTASQADNIKIHLDGVTFESNGRGIWMNNVRTSSELLIQNSHFEDNSSYVVAWQTTYGAHNATIQDSHFDTRNNRALRFFAIATPAGQLVQDNILIQRCTFHNSPTARYPLSFAGFPHTEANPSDPSSTFTATVKNCLFDLRLGDDNAETVAINSQDENSGRLSHITMDHCTVLFGGTLQCGIRFREHQSTLTVRNSIFEAGGAGNAALRGWRGTTESYNNLLNASKPWESAAGGQVIDYGGNIIGEEAGFTDIANNDFTLASDSPAIAAGLNLGITDDLLGNPRPQPSGSMPDLGAYERGDNTSVNNWALY